MTLADLPAAIRVLRIEADLASATSTRLNALADHLEELLPAARAPDEPEPIPPPPPTPDPVPPPPDPV